MNDPSIKITVRTPTSTRDTPSDPPELNLSDTELDYYPELIIFNIVYSMSIPDTEEEFEQALSTSMNSELKCDNTIKINVKTRKATRSDTENSCSICLKNFELNEKVATLPCTHIFHNSCIVQWGKYKQKCPLCRKRIPIH